MMARRHSLTLKTKIAKHLFSAALVLTLILKIPILGYADEAQSSDPSADESRLELKTERVVVFKDGYCLVVKHATGTTDEKGVVFTDDVPDAATLGSFWAVAENATIQSTIAGWVDTEDETDREVSCTNIIEVVKSNLGKRCSFQFEEETIEGTLLKILANEESSAATDAVAASWLRSSGNPISMVSSQLATAPTVSVNVSSVTGSYFIVRTATGDKMVSASSVKNLTIKDMKSSIEQRVTTKSRHKRLSMKFAEANTKVKITVMYFRPDVRWIPTYRVNLTDELIAKASDEGKAEADQEAPRKRAELILQGEILNEAEDFTDVPFHVVVGVPNFRFRDIPSPMVLEGTMRNVLSQANPNILANCNNFFGNDNRLSNVLYNQAGGFQSNRAAGDGERSSVEFPEELAGKAGNDLYVYQLPPMTLKRGERATVPILRTEVQYRDVYTWDIEVTHAETQAATSSQSPLTLNQSKVWRQVELINNSDIPWTTGAAMMVDDFQPLAQELLTYTSPGGICRIPVTVSIDLRGEVNDTEVNRVYNALKWRNRNFARVTGEIKTELANNKAVAVPVEVSLRFGGKATKVSDDGKIALEGYRPEDWRNQQGNAINNSSTVRWTANIEPGECFKPVINYEFLLYH